MGGRQVEVLEDVEEDGVREAEGGGGRVEGGGHGAAGRRPRVGRRAADDRGPWIDPPCPPPLSSNEAVSQPASHQAISLSFF